MTPIFLGGHEKHDDAENERLLRDLAGFYVKSTPVGRAGWPEDIAHAAVYLASDESSYVTGQNLAVEGAINVPLYFIRLKLSTLDKNKPYIVYCDTGRRSSAAAFILVERGFDAYVLKGGLSSMERGLTRGTGS